MPKGFVEKRYFARKISYALMDKSKYKAQMDDIIKISVEKIYQSREVIEKKKWLSNYTNVG
jgi:dGTPase